MSCWPHIRSRQDRGALAGSTCPSGSPFDASCPPPDQSRTPSTSCFPAAETDAGTTSWDGRGKHCSVDQPMRLYPTTSHILRTQAAHGEAWYGVMALVAPCRAAKARSLPEADTTRGLHVVPGRQAPVSNHRRRAYDALVHSRSRDGGKPPTVVTETRRAAESRLQSGRRSRQDVPKHSA